MPKPAYQINSIYDPVCRPRSGESCPNLPTWFVWFSDKGHYFTLLCQDHFIEAVQNIHNDARVVQASVTIGVEETLEPVADDPTLLKETPPRIE